MIDKDVLALGQELLRRPLLPLASMVHFLYLTGDFTTPAEVIDQLPPDIETNHALYPDGAADLRPYAELFAPLAAYKAGQPPVAGIVDTEGQPLDALTAGAALADQQVLTRELERINSLLCASCACTLCCLGPDATMHQAYFEIPLAEAEVKRFAIERIDNAASRAHRADADCLLLIDDRPFYERKEPVLIHWQHGWSLILPREASCPNLGPDGRCRIYLDRPEVCRRPQIFPYVLEPLPDNNGPRWRTRRSLLAVLDCPYVRLLQDEIAAFAAASELDLVFRHNKT
jgi:Fe-S-cluster containining protein